VGTIQKAAGRQVWSGREKVENKWGLAQPDPTHCPVTFSIVRTDRELGTG